MDDVSSDMAQAQLTYDAASREWNCVVTSTGAMRDGAEGYTHGSGPTALSAAMNCAERATAQLAAVRWDIELMVLDADDGWVAIDADGMRKQ